MAACLSPAPRPSPAGSVRVLTLNLWGRNGAWDERRSVLAEGLRRLRPDVVALQEAVVIDGYDQAADLLGSGFCLAHHGGRSEDGTGAVIASRWPIGEVREAGLRVTGSSRPTGGSAGWPPRRSSRRTPSGGCCSSTTSPPGSAALSASASCRPSPPRASSRSYSAGSREQDAWESARLPHNRPTGLERKLQSYCRAGPAPVPLPNAESARPIAGPSLSAKFPYAQAF